MESRTNFDLSKNVELWKSALAKNSKLTLDNLAELESHLGDEIHELQQLGLDAEEAFLVAKKRIGHVKVLTTEFEKVNTSFYFKTKLIPYLKGILLFVAFMTSVELISNLSVIMARKLALNLSYVFIGAFIVSTLLLALIAYKKFKNTDLKLKYFTSIPVLVSVILIGKPLAFLSNHFIVQSVQMQDYVALNLHLSVYKLIFGALILIIACRVFYALKKENKVKIAA